MSAVSIQCVKLNSQKRRMDVAIIGV